MNREAALEQLDKVADEVAQSGNARLAASARDAVRAIRGHIDTCHDVIGVVEAAELLGVRNVGMIDRWAHEGRLAACRMNGGLQVSRRSVEHLAVSPVVANERAFERQMDEVLAEFDFSDEELPPSEASSRGRVPWDDIDSRQR